MKLEKISIKWNLLGYFSFFAAVMLFLLWLFQIVFLESFYKSIKIREIKSSAESIVKNIDNVDMQTFVNSISQENDVCVRVTTYNGADLYSAHQIPDCIIHRMQPFELYTFIQKASQNGGTFLERFSPGGFKNSDMQFEGHIPPPIKGGMESIIYVQLITKKDGTPLVLLLNSTISPVNSTVQTLRAQLIYITLILIVLSFIIALILSKKISKPIIKTNNSAKKLAKGNYDTVFEGKGYLEITELNNTLNYAAKELSQVEGLRRELIANISHDLRTPLTMITGYAEVMRDIPGENNPENVQIIIDESRRLTTLVNDILDISKFQSGTQKLNISRFNLTSSIREILKRYSKFTEQEGYDIKFIYDGDAYINADEMKISQVIYNLINNAITYTGPDKSVILNQSIENNLVKIEIKDTGSGIPDDMLPYIWDRYYKIDKTHKRASVGTGLGLSIVKTILDMHGARYGVQSSGRQGSVFWFEVVIE